MSKEMGSANASRAAAGPLPRIAPDAAPSAAYVALTAYGVQIPKALADRKAAMEWAETHGELFPGCRIVRRVGVAQRTIWKSPEADSERRAA